MKESKLSSGELSAIIFLSSVSFLGAVSGEALSYNYTDTILSAALAAVLNLAMVLPLMKFRGTSLPALWLYIIFFVFQSVLELSSLVYMMQNTVFSKLSPYLFCIIFMLAALYCAFCGIATIGRTAQITVGVVSVCAFFILAAAIKYVETDNFKVFFYDGGHDFGNSLWAILAKTMIAPRMFALISCVREGKKKPFYIAAVSSGLLITATIALVLFCLGGFAETQEFPVFTLASFLDLSPLQRLDIFLGIALLSSSLVSIASCLGAVSVLLGKTDEKGNKITISAVSAIIAITAAFIATKPEWHKLIFMPEAVVVAGIILGLIVPTITAKLGKENHEET